MLGVQFKKIPSEQAFLYAGRMFITIACLGVPALILAPFEFALALLVGGYTLAALTNRALERHLKRADGQPSQMTTDDESVPENFRVLRLAA